MTASPESLVKVKSGAGRPASTGKHSSTRRAIGVVRVSRVGDRDGESFVSPSEQAERIRTACERDGLELIDILEEPNVSGGAPLERRPGLRRAVAMLESGEAEVVVVAYFDRLVRSLAVQREVVERVEQAGGAIVAVDVGEVRADTASRWLSSTMLGMVAEYHRRVTAERTEDAKRRAIERGVPTFSNVTPAYRKREDGRLEPSEHATAVADAMRLRANGATIAEARAYLAQRGVKLSYHGVQHLLSSRILLGELHFGKYSNLSAHPAVIDVETWNRAQRQKLPRGPRPKSDRLLARLGILRCETCGARMVVGSSQGSYSLYRCPPVGDCPRRVTISAPVAEKHVVDEVKRLLADVTGTASVDTRIAEAEAEVEQSETELDAAVAAFSGLEDVASARQRLVELRDARDAARDRLSELRVASVPAVAITASGDWDDLTSDERRALIRAVVDRVTVSPGRGPDRITVYPRGE